MKLIQLMTAADVHARYTPDKLTQSVDYNPEKGIFQKFACTTILFIERDGQRIVTTEWFITETNNELIYDIAGNDWVNLDLFDTGESYCTGIYTMAVEQKDDRLTIIPPTTLIIPAFVAKWYNEQVDITDEDVFEYLMKLDWYGDDLEDYVIDSIPFEIIEYANNRANRLILLRLLNDERFDISN